MTVNNIDKNFKKYNLNLVITAHNEQSILKESIESMELAEKLWQNLKIEYTKIKKINKFILLDAPDKETTKLVEGLGVSWFVKINHFNDIAKNRNKILEYIKGQDNLILFLDGDDLISSNFILQINNMLDIMDQKIIENSVFHSQLSVYFPDKNEYMLHEDSDCLKLNALLYVNYWSLPILVSENVLRNNLFYSNDFKLKRGIEDWTFNISTIAKGIRHIPIKNTVSFIRDRENSQNKKDVEKKLKPHQVLNYIQKLYNVNA